MILAMRFADVNHDVASNCIVYNGDSSNVETCFKRRGSGGISQMYDLSFKWASGNKKRFRPIDQNEHHMLKKQIHEGLQNLSLSLEESDVDALKSEMQYVSEIQLENDSKDVVIKNHEIQGNGFGQPFTIPFHRGKYGRRVDYLVDELIRKSRRVAEQYNSNCYHADSDFQIPSNVGPQPTTDLALMPSWPNSFSVTSLTPQDSSSALGGTFFSTTSSTPQDSSSALGDTFFSTTSSTPQDSTSALGGTFLSTTSSKTSSILKPPASCNLSSLADPQSSSYSSRSHTEWEILDVDTNDSNANSTGDRNRHMASNNHNEYGDSMMIDGLPLEVTQSFTLLTQDYEDSDDSDPGIVVP